MIVVVLVEVPSAAVAIVAEDFERFAACTIVVYFANFVFVVEYLATDLDNYYQFALYLVVVSYLIVPFYYPLFLNQS